MTILIGEPLPLKAPLTTLLSHDWKSESYNEIIDRLIVLPSRSPGLLETSARRETLSRRFSAATTQHFFLKLYSMKWQKTPDVEKERKLQTLKTQ